jgi:glycerol kinase
MAHPSGQLIGAIDAGTTGARFVLFDDRARCIASAYRPIPVAMPRPGWVEQDPDDILSSTIEALSATLDESVVRGRPIVAIGLANQRETIAAWEQESGRPLHSAIVWQDRRTARRCDDLPEAARRLIPSRTGLRADPYFSATKVEWLLEHVPGLADRAAAGTATLGTIDSWLIRQLTGGLATDDTNACRTMLFDIDARAWDDDLLEFFQVPRACLPQVAPSLSTFGEIRPDLVGGRSVRLAGVLGDQQAALYGQGIAAKGRAQVTWGTGAFLLMEIGPDRPLSRTGLVTTIARTAPNRAPSYALEGSVFVAGAAIQWLRDALGLVQDAAESAALSETVDSTEGVVFVPALTGLGAPHWDPDARGLIVGITRGTQPAHIVRAALESIAFQTLDVVRAMERDAGIKVEELRVGGGASANNFLCQFQSDILGVPVVRPADLETTARGAAYAAGVAIGLWEEADVTDWLSQDVRRFLPSFPAAQREALIDRWHNAVDRAHGWDRHAPANEPEAAS